MKINSIESAIDIIIDTSIKYSETVENGNYRLGNKLQDKMDCAAKYLKDNQCLKNLKKLLDHENMQVRLSSAYYLLEIEENIACHILKDIANKNLNHISTSAAIIIERWSSGELKIYFGKE